MKSPTRTSELRPEIIKHIAIVRRRASSLRTPIELSYELSESTPFAMRTLRTCRHKSEPIEKRFRDTLMFDPVQAPSLRHALELVNAAILEADSRLRHQVLDRARDQDFAGTRFRRD